MKLKLVFSMFLILGTLFSFASTNGKTSRVNGKYSLSNPTIKQQSPNKVIVWNTVANNKKGEGCFLFVDCRGFLWEFCFWGLEIYEAVDMAEAITCYDA